MIARASMPRLLVSILLPLILLLQADDARAQDGTLGEASPPVQLAQAATVGSDVCLECHNEAPTNLILHTPHAQTADNRTPFARGGCETCHGPGAAHADNPDVAIGVSYGPRSSNPAAEQSGVCLGCHQSGDRMNWHMSKHEAADRPCSSCHNVHARKDPMLQKASQIKVCVACHTEQRAGLVKRSRHPMREGIIACSDCHNPHGSFSSEGLVKASVNETCFGCHAEKRGPFLWEHQPVAEDCSICHNPHGTTQPKLLKARGPFLCQTCHQASFHPSTLYDGGAVTRADTHLLANNCLNCHPRVHGSNHPSGKRFAR
ncbi:MAG: DmsE family decaheme c-type cytochrome [Rhodospirillales bacterium]|nr:MAG: DmsE family decaheme c-type cytochrome [Rhodospirillales bacterium]